MMQKTYIAICDINGQTPAPDRWTIDNHMGEVGKRHGKSVYGAVKSGGDRAVTEFEVIERSKKILAVFARPKTGRTHQIRAHLLSCGLPIIGDQLYHPALAARRAQEPSQRLMLHAFELAFPHPVDGRQLSFRAPIPPAFVSLLPRMAAALKGSPDLTNPMDLT
jgi:23S rRNA-/tRNA-specific pseudouridylate synthase